VAHEEAQSSIAMHGEALRRHFEHPGKDRRIDGSLLKIGKQSGLLGPAGSGRDPLGHDRRFFGDAERHQNEGISERPLQGGQAVNDPQPIRGGPVRACRQGRRSHRRKGRDGGERLA